MNYYGDPLTVFRQKIVQREKEGRPIEGFEVEMVLEIRNTERRSRRRLGRAATPPC